MSLATQWPSLGVGALLIAPGTPLPPEWRLVNDSVVSGWSRVATTFATHQLEKEPTGWTFFFMASPDRDHGVRIQYAKDAGLGADAPHRGSKAAKMQLPRDRLYWRALIPWNTMRAHSAHPRHIQKGMVFSGQ